MINDKSESKETSPALIIAKVDWNGTIDGKTPSDRDWKWYLKGLEHGANAMRNPFKRIDMIAKDHPEAICQNCAGHNIGWFAPNDLWNEVVGSEGGIFCPDCFAAMAAEKDISVWFTTNTAK